MTSEYLTLDATLMDLRAQSAAGYGLVENAASYRRAALALRAHPDLVGALERMLRERGCAGCAPDAPARTDGDPRTKPDQHLPGCPNVSAIEAIEAARRNP